MKRYLNPIIWTLLLTVCALFGHSQTDKVLVLKVKEAYRSQCTASSISIPEFQLFESHFQLQNIKKIFPLQTKPLVTVNKFGDTLVDLSLVYSATLPNSAFQTAEVCNQLMKSGLFEYALPKNTHQALYTPNDPSIVNQYYLTNIQAYQAWDISKGDSTIVVGISDTGFDFNHNDLKGAVAYNKNDSIDGIDNDNDGYIDNYQGWDLGTNDNNPQYASQNHGVFVSGLVSAQPDNGIGMAGVGYYTKILPLKIADANNVLTQGYESIVYAATHGCKIINCSWGGQMPDGKFGEDIVNFATYNCNALVVTACGNSNSIVPFWPASYENVLSVSSTDNTDTKSDFSSYGWFVDLSAPGSNVLSTVPSNTYTYSGGTSFSAPIVAACAAIVKAHFPTYTPFQLAERLKVTADHIDTLANNLPYAGKMGRGRVNLYRALSDPESPSIKYSNAIFSKQNMQTGDTITLSADFTNYLATTTNLTIQLSIVESDITLIDSTISAAPIAAFEKYNNSAAPFRFVLGSNSANSEAIFKLIYSDNGYTGFEYIRVYVNQDYINVDTNHIATSFTGNSRLGFNNNLFDEGLGFNYMGNNQLFYVGGLMIGKNSDYISDNVYNETSYDEDFVNMVPPVKVTTSDFADFCGTTTFNDSGAGSKKMDLQVTQNIYAWNQPDCQDFIVCSYTIKNTGTSTQSGLNAGLFVDWDIYLSSYNKAKYSADSKMMYAWCPYGGKYGAVAALTQHEITRYAFDNNGSNLSFNISMPGGFNGLEKYSALTANRDSSGYSGSGNDISALVTYNQFNLTPNDSITLDFALIAGSDPQSLANSAAMAYQKMHPSSDKIAETANGTRSLRIRPNPASNEVNIHLQGESLKTVEIFDLFGKRCTIDIQQAPDLSFRVSTSSLSNGVYLVKGYTAQGSITQKLIITH